MTSRADARLATLFSGAALVKEKGTARSAAMRLAQPDLLSTAAGADTFLFNPPVLPNLHTVLYTGSYRSWATVAQVQDHGKIVSATPSNVLNFTATLKDDSGTWKVDSLDWTFAPGSEP